MKIQSEMESIGKYGCLAFCYIKSTLPKGLGDFEEKCMMASSIMALMEAGIIDDECYVKDAVKLLDYIDPAYEHSVEKKDIESMKDLRGTSGPVRFDYNGHSHFVYQENGIVVFDSLENSQCRKYGKPTSARIVNKKEKK